MVGPKTSNLPLPRSWCHQRQGRFWTDAHITWTIRWRSANQPKGSGRRAQLTMNERGRILGCHRQSLPASSSTVAFHFGRGGGVPGLWQSQPRLVLHRGTSEPVGLGGSRRETGGRRPAQGRCPGKCPAGPGSGTGPPPRRGCEFSRPNILRRAARPARRSNPRQVSEGKDGGADVSWRELLSGRGSQMLTDTGWNWRRAQTGRRHHEPVGLTAYDPRRTAVARYRCEDRQALRRGPPPERCQSDPADSLP